MQRATISCSTTWLKLDPRRRWCAEVLFC